MKGRGVKLVSGISAFVVVAGILYSLALSFQHTVSWTCDQLRTIVPRWSSSPDKKWEAILGDYYGFIRFVVGETPPSARILVPPGSLPMNIWMHNYFLFPRKLFRDDRSGEEMDYIMVYGSPPDPTVEGERIMLDEKRGLIKVRKGK